MYRRISLGETIDEEFYIIMSKKCAQYLVCLIVVIINDFMPVRARQCVISVCFNYQFSFYQWSSFFVVDKSVKSLASFTWREMG